jgi:DNA-binding MarR family transcriptional regulator
MALFKEDALSTGSLSKQVYLSAGTITGIIDRLEKKGSARRIRDDKDRRVVKVQMTESGRELIRKTPSPLQEKLVVGLQNLNADRKQEILNSLNQVLDLMEVRDDQASPILEVGPMQAPQKEERTE